jgi:hypothetical protein
MVVLFDLKLYLAFPTITMCTGIMFAARRISPRVALKRVNM